MQSISLRAFHKHVLNQEVPVQAADPPLYRAKLMAFLIDEAYFDMQERIQPVSDLCFIQCYLENTNDKESIKLVEHMQKVKVCPQMTVLSPGTSVIEHLQRSRQIKACLIDAIVQKMED